MLFVENLQSHSRIQTKANLSNGKQLNRPYPTETFEVFFLLLSFLFVCFKMFQNKKGISDAHFQSILDSPDNLPDIQIQISCC